MQNYPYQIGGSLRIDAPCYVEREADRQLLEALQRGEFCYVLNSRQMGKSSLLVRTMHRLEAAGYRCSTVDITGIGSENITPKQWYKGIVAELWQGFSLYRQQKFRQWWTTATEDSAIRRLGKFFSEVLLARYPEDRFVVFIDEIDSVLSLPFSIDDFFAFIRFCYNQRALDARYNRLTFAVFGVATPSDLIQDRQRTPFNIGTAIELRGFALQEVQPLIDCLDPAIEPAQKVMSEILWWTGGQPFLTQKICQLTNDCARGEGRGELAIAPGRERAFIERLILDKIVRNWEFQDEPEHLRTIRARLQYHPERAGRLLGMVLRILQGEIVAPDDSQAQAELLLSGLVARQSDRLCVKNRIYAEVFDCDWVAAQLDLLRPYARSLDAWLASERTDNSRLLRGQALQDARDWSQDKSLSDLDYQYLTASEMHDRYEMQQELEAGRAAAVAAQLTEERRRRHQEQKNTRLQRYLLGALSTILLVTLGLGTEAFLLYRRAILSEIDALATSSLAASTDNRFNSRSQLDALVRAIRAKRLLQQVAGSTRPTTVEPVETALQQAIYNIAEANRFSGHREAVTAVAFSPDGQTIATAGVDATVRLWRPDGISLGTLVGHANPIGVLAFSMDGRWLATAGAEAEVYLWQLSEGTSGDPAAGEIVWPRARLVSRLDTGLDTVRGLAFHPERAATLAVAGSASRIQLWNVGAQTQVGSWGRREDWESVRFSPDGRFLAAVNRKGTASIWQSNGRLITSLSPGRGPLRDVAFAPNGRSIALVGEDSTIALWQQQQASEAWLEVAQAVVPDGERLGKLSFAPDGKQLAAAGDSGRVWLWRSGLEGWAQPLPARSLDGHGDGVTAVAFSPDGRFLASASRDRTARLWRPDNPLQRSLIGHRSAVTGAAFAANSRSLVSVSRDRTIRLWRVDGRPARTLRPPGIAGLQTVARSPAAPVVAVARESRGVSIWDLDSKIETPLIGHSGSVLAAAFESDGRRVATGGDDRTVRLWHPDGMAIDVLRGHTDRVLGLAFSPTDGLLASAGADKTIKLWSRAGKLERTLHGHAEAVAGVAFSPAGNLIASASYDRTVKLWRRDGTLLRNLTGHQDAVLAVDIGGPGGGIVATGSRDRTIRLWQRDNPGSPPIVLGGHQAAVLDVAFSPDGKWLLSTGEDNRLLLWQIAAILEQDNLIEAACDWVRNYLQTNAELTLEERRLCSGIASENTNNPSLSGS